MSNLASRYRDQGLYEKAEKLGVQELELLRLSVSLSLKALGDNRPDTTGCKQQLAQ
jgi:hypothetical protein